MLPVILNCFKLDMKSMPFYHTKYTVEAETQKHIPNFIKMHLFHNKNMHKKECVSNLEAC